MARKTYRMGDNKLGTAHGCMDLGCSTLGLSVNLELEIICYLLLCLAREPYPMGDDKLGTTGELRYLWCGILGLSVNLGIENADCMIPCSLSLLISKRRLLGRGLLSYWVSVVVFSFPTVPTDNINSQSEAFLLCSLQW